MQKLRAPGSHDKEKIRVPATHPIKEIVQRKNNQLPVKTMPTMQMQKTRNRGELNGKN